jgi:hypothetical protein
MRDERSKERAGATRPTNYPNPTIYPPIWSIAVEGAKQLGMRSASEFTRHAIMKEGGRLLRKANKGEE